MFKLIKNILFNRQFSKLAVYGFGQAFNLITPLLVAPYIISICGKDVFGKVSACLAVYFFLMVFVDYGSDIAGVKDVSVYREDKAVLSSMLNTAYASRLVMLAAVLLLVVLSVMAIPALATEKAMYFMAFPVLAAQAISPVWVFQGLEDFKWATFINIFSKGFYLAGVFISVKHPEDYIYINLFWGMGMLLANAAALWYLSYRFGINIARTSTVEVSAFLKKHFALLWSQIFFSLQMYAPLIIVKWFGGDALAGRYRIIEQVLVIFRTYILLFFNFVYPRVCYLLEQNIAACIRLWRTYNGANFLFIVISMVLVYGNAGLIVNHFDPAETKTLAHTLRIATGLPLAFGISVPLRQLLLAYGLQKAYVRITFVMVVSSLVLLISLLYRYGINGAITALILAEAATAALFAVAIKTRPRHH